MSLAETQEPRGYGFSEQAHLAGTIAGDFDDVLPRLEQAQLEDAMRRLPAEELALSLRCKLLPLVNLPGLTLFVACGEPALAIARHDGLKVVGYAESQTFIAAARHLFGAPMIAEAAGGLARRRPWLSAKRRLTPWQMGMALCLLAVVVIMWVVLPVALAWMIASTIGGLFFLSVIALRVLSLLPRPRREAPLPAALAEHDLPIYSVLVPLFRETSVLGQLLDALTKLDYPALCRKRTKTA
ncbi:MAG: hypothetical protein KDK75_05130 [Alphaproteobacteria bacterium]|nr:hypothetical protein [Alphaproteobacteria bacterium]